MRVYTLSDLDKFYISPYARMQILPEGIGIFYNPSDEMLVIHTDKRSVGILWRMLEKGAGRQEYEALFSRIDNRLFIELLRRGMIE